MKKVFLVLIIIITAGCLKQHFLPFNQFSEDVPVEPANWGVARYHLSAADTSSVIKYDLYDNGIEIVYNFNSGTWLQVEYKNNLDLSECSGFLFIYKGTGADNRFQIKFEDDTGAVHGINLDNSTSTVNWRRCVVEEQEVYFPMKNVKYFWGGAGKIDWKKVNKICFTIIKKDGGEGSIVIRDFIYYQKSKEKKIDEAPNDMVIARCDTPGNWLVGTAENSYLKLLIALDKGDEGDERSLKLNFDIKSSQAGGGWMYCNYPLSEMKSDFHYYQGLSFYLKGDGSDNAVYLYLKDSEGEHFISKNKFTLDKKEFEKYTVHFTDFISSGYQPEKDKLTNPGVMDLEKVQEIGITISDLGDIDRKGYLYFDCITLIK